MELAKELVDDADATQTGRVGPEAPAGRAPEGCRVGMSLRFRRSGSSLLRSYHFNGAYRRFVVDHVCELHRGEPPSEESQTQFETAVSGSAVPSQDFRRCLLFCTPARIIGHAAD